MRYIRFLKTPRIAQEKNSPKAHLYSLITITSDLGDSFLPLDLILSVELLDPKADEVVVWKTAQWKSGMRSLPITLPLSKSQKIWPLQLRVSIEPRSNFDEFTVLSDNDCPGIVSALSAEIDPTNGVEAAEKIVERRFRVRDETLRIVEETGESIARHLWDAGVMLSTHIGNLFNTGQALSDALRRPKYKKRVQVLELGTGCGMVGIAIARALPQADVLLTDLSEAQEIVERNMAMTSCASDTKLRFQELDWENDITNDFNDWTSCLHCRQIDIIVAADCTYNPDSSPAFVNTIRQVAVLSPHVTIAIAMKMRHPSEDVFFKLMAEAKLRAVDMIAIPLPGDEKLGEETVNVHIYQYEGEGYKAVLPAQDCISSC